jgi:hypothetical protein
MDEDLVDCPPHSDFRLPEGIEYLVGYNVDYDWRVIGEPPIKRICVLALARSLLPGLDSYSQSAALYAQQDFLVGVDSRPGLPTKQQPNAVTWSGEIPAQKWMTYTKVLTRLGVSNGIRLTVNVECKPAGGFSRQKVEEIKSALRELGLNDRID